jgi:hypothetical protein
MLFEFSHNRKLIPKRFPEPGGVSLISFHRREQDETDLSNKTTMFQVPVYIGADTYCNKSMSPV